MSETKTDRCVPSMRAMIGSAMEGRRAALEDLAISERLIAAFQRNDELDFFDALMEPFQKGCRLHDGLSEWLISCPEVDEEKIERDCQVAMDLQLGGDC